MVAGSTPARRQSISMIPSESSSRWHARSTSRASPERRTSTARAAASRTAISSQSQSGGKVHSKRMLSPSDEVCRAFSTPPQSGRSHRTTTRNSQRDSFPAASLARQLTVVVPIGKTEPGSGTQATCGLSSALSVAVTLNDTSAPLSSSQSTRIPSGQMMSGGVSSGEVSGTPVSRSRRTGSATRFRRRRPPGIERWSCRLERPTRTPEHRRRRGSGPYRRSLRPRRSPGAPFSLSHSTTRSLAQTSVGGRRIFRWISAVVGHSDAEFAPPDVPRAIARGAGHGGHADRKARSGGRLAHDLDTDIRVVRGGDVERDAGPVRPPRKRPGGRSGQSTFGAVVSRC